MANFHYNRIICGDYTIQYIGDYDNLTGESLHTNQDYTWGFPARHGGTPISWMVYFREHRSYKWMINGATPIYGKPHSPSVTF